MDAQIIPRTPSPFEAIKHTHPSGAERWSARDLMPLLGYEKWERFADAIDRALVSIANAGGNPDAEASRLRGLPEVPSRLREEPRRSAPRGLDQGPGRLGVPLGHREDARRGAQVRADLGLTGADCEVGLRGGDLGLPGVAVHRDHVAGVPAEGEEADTKARALEAKVTADAPKVVFADAVSTAQTSILIRELAKLMQQAGISVTPNALFGWLRADGYLIRQQSSDYNLPTQKSRDLGLFEIKETPIVHDDGRVHISRTPKVTGRGQAYFITHYLGKAS
jgi:phage antirepressor YoqD-like protein